MRWPNAISSGWRRIGSPRIHIRRCALAWTPTKTGTGVCALHHLSIDESGRVVRSPRNPCVRVIFMDPTNHIPSVTLFHYLNGSMPLTDDERYHLDHCAYCQSVVSEYKKYIDPAMIPAACNLGDREQLRHPAMER